MCTCTSCKATDALAGWNRRASGWWRRLPDGRLLPDTTAGGFARWPKGEPAGRRSAADYAAHVAYSKHGAIDGMKIGTSGIGFYGGGKRAAEVLAATFAQQIECEWVPTNINPVAEKAGPAPYEAEPVSPAPACKPAQHFPRLDRRPETGRIYAMPKREPQQQKRPRGRPPLSGRRVVIKLEERHIKRAAELGDDNVAAGIRKALSR